MTSVSLTWLGIAGITALSLAGFLLSRLRGYRSASEAEPGDDGSFSPARYEPMARLLAEDDFVFLAAQPGYRPEIGTKLRRDRRRIFRLYLRALACDFHRLHAHAREMVAASSQEHHERLVGLLLRQQVTFWRALAAIELRLLAERMGLGKVEIRGLVEVVEAMRLDLARFTPATPGW
jgi:hypothetical protein